MTSQLQQAINIAQNLSLVEQLELNFESSESSFRVI